MALRPRLTQVLCCTYACVRAFGAEEKRPKSSHYRFFHVVLGVGGGLVSSIWPRFLLANGCEDPNDWICVQAWNIRK